MDGMRTRRRADRSRTGERVPPRAEVRATSRARAIGQSARERCGGECAVAGGRAGRTHAEVAEHLLGGGESVTTARSLRRPPYEHLQTSALKVWRCRKAQHRQPKGKASRCGLVLERQPGMKLSGYSHSR
jgi:hypothetical protein